MPRDFTTNIGATRQQSITWGSTDPVVCRYTASLYHNLLSFTIVCIYLCTMPYVIWIKVILLTITSVYYFFFISRICSIWYSRHGKICVLWSGDILCHKLCITMLFYAIQIKYGLPYCVTCPSMSTDPGSLNPGTRRSRVPGWWDPGIRTNTGAGDTVLAKHT